MAQVLRRAVPFVVWAAAIAGLVWVGAGPRPTDRIVGVVTSARVQVVSPADGPLAAMAVALHQPVERGQVLGRLDDAALILRLTKATQELHAMEAEIELARAEQRQEAARRQAASELDATTERRRRETDVESAQLAALRTRAEIEEVRIRAQTAAIDAERVVALEGQGLASAAVLLQARTSEQALRERLQRLEALQERQIGTVEAAAQRLATFQAAAVDGLPDRATAMQWRLRGQQTALDEVALERERLVLRAPLAGQVVELAVAGGEWLRAGQPLLTIVDPTPDGIVAYVAAAALPRVQESQRLVVRDEQWQPLGTAAVRSVSTTVVAVPERLWLSPDRAEYAFAVLVAPTGRERSGELVRLGLPD